MCCKELADYPNTQIHKHTLFFFFFGLMELLYDICGLEQRCLNPLGHYVTFKDILRKLFISLVPSSNRKILPQFKRHILNIIPQISLPWAFYKFFFSWLQYQIHWAEVFSPTQYIATQIIQKWITEFINVSGIWLFLKVFPDFQIGQ